MAFNELKHYRSYILEVREFGDTGWAVHTYAPRIGAVAHKVAVVASPHPRDLRKVILQAQAAVDADLAQRPR